LLCTYARAEALGCTANSGYSLESNQLVYEGSVKKKETTCTYTVISTTPDTVNLSSCYPQSAYATVKYNVSGYENATNQTKRVSFNTARCTRSSCNYTSGTTFNHGDCPNYQVVSWTVTKSGCQNYSANNCISVKSHGTGYTEYYNNCFESVTYTWTYSGSRYTSSVGAHTPFSLPQGATINSYSWTY